MPCVFDLSSDESASKTEEGNLIFRVAEDGQPARREILSSLA
jgi:hypothetical protein